MARKVAYFVAAAALAVAVVANVLHIQDAVRDQDNGRLYYYLALAVVSAAVAVAMVVLGVRVPSAPPPQTRKR
jgi:hypothetical protein